MKASARPLAARVTGEDKGFIAIYSDLFKARLTLLVLLTTLVGFYVGSGRIVDYELMFHTALGTAFLACGASALNQLLERKYDGLMQRTADRPLPSGRLEPHRVLSVGIFAAVLGLSYLYAAVNLPASLAGGASLLVYLFLYTPLKRITWLNTLVGAVAGALPPLIGWVGAQGAFTARGWTLFGILALWQLPHFMAIAWLYREDYGRAGFQMLPVVDTDGRRTGFQAVVHTIFLVAVSCTPFLTKQAGPVYLAGALVLGLAFLWFSARFALRLTTSRAKQLFAYSVAYLPLLLGLMVLDKVR